MTDEPSNPYRIERLYLRELGPFRELDLKLGEKKDPKKADLHLLVGPNGCGKTTILHVIAEAIALGELGVPNSAPRARGEKSVYAVRTETGSVLVLERGFKTMPDVWSAPGLVPWSVGSASGGGNPADPRFLAPHEHQARAKFFAVLGSGVKTGGDRLAFAPFAYSGSRRVTSYALQSISELTSGPLANALSFEHTADTEQFVRWVANQLTKAALAHADGDELAAARYRVPLQRVEEALTSVTGAKMRLVLRRDPLAVVLERDGEQLQLGLLPDGLKSILSWLGDLVMRLDRLPWVDDTPLLDRTFLLLLDEIDIHLHPAWQRKVLPMVQSLFPNAQIIVSTHSPFVVASVSDAWVYRFAVRDGVATLAEVFPSQAGMSYREVLQSTFRITEEFDVETEKDLDAFYALRDRVLAGAHELLPELRGRAQALAKRSEALEDITTSELLQLQRRLPPAA